MLVTPAATALLLTGQLSRALPLAVGLAAFASIVGLYVSFYANVASGAATVLVSTALFAAVLISDRSRASAATEEPVT
jgi:iron/zinc/copper transport system permease protein